MDKIVEELIKQIRTKEELIFLLEEITQVKQAIFKHEKKLLSKKVEGKVSKDLQKFIERLENDGKISKNRGGQLNFWKQIEKELQSLPEIKLEIAFSPSNDFLEKVSQWLEKVLGKKIILNLFVNPKIIAGVIIEYQGQWRDFSLAKEVDKSF